MWIVGRDDRADIIIPLPQVSSLHALIEQLPDGGFLVRDLASSNGTFVNGRRIEQDVATPGSDVRFGSAVLDWSRFGSLLSGTPAGRSVTIGRDQANDWSIDDPRISSRHAVVLHRSGVALVVDLGSSNGVFVNGRRVFAEAIGPGDQVRLGSFDVDLGWLWAETPGPATAPPPPELPAEAESGIQPPPTTGKTRRLPSLRWCFTGAATVAVAVLAALFFTGTIWPYWFRPYEDPWPAAVESSTTIISDHPSLHAKVQSAITGASRIEEQAVFLENARPVLSQIDSWRDLKVSGDMHRAISLFKNFTSVDLPDNAYDAVLAALEKGAPGTGQTLREMEVVVRGILETRDDLGSLVGALRATDQALTNFETDPGRRSLEDLNSRVDDLRRRSGEAGPDLRKLAEQAGAVSAGIDLLRGGIFSASQTRMGNYLQPQLMAVYEFLENAATPIREFDMNTEVALESVASAIDVFDEVKGQSDLANASDAQQRKRHARGMPAP